MHAPLRERESHRSANAVLPVAPSYERRRLRLHIVQLLGDIAALLAGFAMAGFLYTGAAWEARALMQAQLLLPLFVTIALYNGTYSIASLSALRTAISRMGAALLISAALLNFIAFYAKANTQFSRVTFTLGLVIAALLMIGLRRMLADWTRWRLGVSLINCLVIDDGGPALALRHANRVDALASGLSPSLDDPHGLDRLGRVLHNMDRVVVSCPPERRGEWAFVLKCAGVRGEVLSDTVRHIGAIGVHHYPDDGVSALVVSTGPLGLRARAMKRGFDLGLSGLALVLLAPLLVVVAVAIKLDDGGPVLFAQRRMGRGNRLFGIYKFRTMAVKRGDADGARSASRGDDRLTRIGAFLRMTSIDELPQLWNVLRGEMSLVGPRPHALASQAGEKLFWEVDRRYWQRHALKPGLTGLAQIRGLRGATEQETHLADRLQADLEYVHAWSLWRDFAIVISTLRVLIHERAF